MNVLQVLLVEDNPGDVRLTREALKEAEISIALSTVSDGVEAMKYLFKEGSFSEEHTPDLILLDLNMPRMDGRELLKKIKNSASTRTIPVIVLTTSESEKDIFESYNLHANCYISKPVDMDEFVSAVKSVGDFWLRLARLPSDKFT